MLLAMADFVVILDASIVNIALPSIGRGASHLARQPLVGGQRVRADLRRVSCCSAVGSPTWSAAA